MWSPGIPHFVRNYVDLSSNRIRIKVSSMNGVGYHNFDYVVFYFDQASISFPNGVPLCLTFVSERPLLRYLRLCSSRITSWMSLPPPNPCVGTVTFSWPKLSQDPRLCWTWRTRTSLLLSIYCRGTKLLLFGCSIFFSGSFKFLYILFKLVAVWIYGLNIGYRISISNVLMEP